MCQKQGRMSPRSQYLWRHPPLNANNFFLAKHPDIITEMTSIVNYKSLPGAVTKLLLPVAVPLVPAAPCAGLAIEEAADATAAAGAEEAAGAKWGGRSFSMSCFPNSHPGGSVSSEQRAKRTVDSQTRLV